MNNSKVTATQFFSLMYLSVLGSVFMYISSSKVLIATTDSIFRPFVFVIIGVAVAVPAVLLHKKQKTLSEGTLSVLKKSTVYKIVSVLFAAVYFFDALMTVARFDLFASSELFPGTDMTFFIVALIVICCVLALLGLGGLSRASVIFTVTVAVATVFASLTLIKEVDTVNYTPLFENGVGKFISDSLLFCLQMSELGTIFLYLPQIEGVSFKKYVFWLCLSAVSFAFVLFFVVGTLGVFADTQLFPTYSAVSLAEFGLFERLDALETAVWILCIVTKLTFYVMTVIKCIRFAFPKIKEKVIASVCGVIISAVIVFVSLDVERFAFISAVPVIAVVFLLPVIVLPSVLLLFTFITGRKNSEKSF